MDIQLYFLISAFVFAFGACVGSFLNVVIWRLPRNESLVSPPSHCPKCDHKISAWENIPILSYLILKGKCHGCGLRISARYPTIELITAIIFVGTWGRIWSQQLPMGTAIAYFYLASAALAIALIDWEHLIIPNEITYTGIVLAFVIAIIFPAPVTSAATTAPVPFENSIVELLASYLPLINTNPRIFTSLATLVSLAIPMALLWVILEAGKCLWGRLSKSFSDPQTLTMNKDELDIPEYGHETWANLLYRKRDRFKATITTIHTLETDSPQANFPETNPQTPCEITVTDSQITISGQALPLSSLKSCKAEITDWEIPREVMGFGDVKLVAMLGALLGLEAVFFTLMLAALAGSLTGVMRLLIKPGNRHQPIPFGSFLALATFAWIFAGNELINIYISLLSQANSLKY